MSFPGDIPTANVLTVSKEYAWTFVQLGTATHYCFVGLAGNALDPAPDITYLKSLTWAQYEQFIRANNNITWRNFNMSVPASPSPPPPPPLPSPLPKKKWRLIEFISPGLPKITKKMHLEVIAYLPEGGEAVLEVPSLFGEALPNEIGFRVPEFWKREIDKNRKFILVDQKKKLHLFPVNPNGITKLEEVEFPADSISNLKLYVYIPEKYEKQHYTIAVRQMLEGNEIGRVTWRLVPPVKRK
jgi:hypothetical protein